MADNRENIFDTLTEDVANSSNLPESEKQKMLQNILHLRSQKLNIMITGATGAGKSSTINALFDANVAKVGVGSTPETMDIKKYELNNLILWDSPGLGDGKAADERHSRNIINKLREQDSNGKALIDLVLVILDGSTRDYGTSYELINNVVIPNLGNASDKKNRILVAINQCDAAMKGKHWNWDKNMPDSTLENFLNEKVRSVQSRIKDSTGVDIEPIYYSAGYKESDDEKQNPYNLSKLLYFIIQHTPEEKRLVYVDTLSKEKENWKDNEKFNQKTKSDSKEPENEKPQTYQEAIQESFAQTIVTHVVTGATIGKTVGGVFGKTGEKIGAVVGGVVGAGVAFGKKIWKSIFG